MGNPPQTDEEVIHSKLSFQWRSRTFDDDRLEDQRKAFFFDLNLAYDALAYDRYPLVSQASSVSAFALQGYAHEHDRRAITLTSRQQTQMLDALTEVTGIPHERGRTEVPIPENALNRSKVMREAAKQEARARQQPPLRKR